MGAEVRTTGFWDSGARDAVILRPFFSSRTGEALLRLGSGALNFADDVFLFALTALTDELPPSRGPVLEGAPYWWAISVVSSEEDCLAGRWAIECRVEAKNFDHPFSPFNRAKGAAIEAAILATRIGLSGADRAGARERIAELEKIAEKTGGERELEAFRLIRSKVE
jgi:hypothetical protein